MRGQAKIEASLQRQDKGLADFANGNAFGSLFECCFEPFDWFAQRFEAEPESLMMHRHDESRASGVRHFNRLLRRAMVPDPWVVSCDRHDREIDGPVLAKLGKSVRQRGVPSEQNAPSISLQVIAIVTAMSVSLLPCAPVFHLKGADSNLSGGSFERFPLTPAKFGDVVEPRPSQEISSVWSSDYNGVFIKPVERSQIEMIKVRVRQKDNVDLWQFVEFECGRGQSFGTDGESRQSNPDVREKDGVGENLYSEKIDEHRRVADPGHRYLRIIPLRRFRFGKSWSNRPPRFDRPFAPKMTKPTTHARTAQSRLFSRFH